MERNNEYKLTNKSNVDSKNKMQITRWGKYLCENEKDK